MTLSWLDLALIYTLPVVGVWLLALVIAVAIRIGWAETLHADMTKYLARKEYRFSVPRLWVALLGTPCVQVIVLFRMAHVLYRKNLRFPAHVLRRLGVVLAGIDIHPGARIGRGFEIFHGLGMVIGEDVDIGENVLVCHGVTIGYPIPGTPKIGNNAKLYVGATVVGPFTIGDNATIGANVLVMSDIPAHATVVSNRPRVIPSTDRAGDRSDALSPEGADA